MSHDATGDDLFHPPHLLGLDILEAVQVGDAVVAHDMMLAGLDLELHAVVQMVPATFWEESKFVLRGGHDVGPPQLGNLPHDA